jgi:hypothetical protein
MILGRCPLNLFSSRAYPLRASVLDPCLRDVTGNVYVTAGYPGKKYRVVF